MLTICRHLFGLVGVAAASAILLVSPPLASDQDTDARSQGLLAHGLKIWQKPGAIMGGAACATCHSPDGIELAAFNFDDADITRRAREHLGTEDTRDLVEYIHAMRTRLHLYPLRDPNRDRPLQPGGAVLAGETPAARDLAFGLEIKAKLPRLFDHPIDTIEQAKAAESELLSLSPVSLKIGIPLNRLSEDIAHGNEHASIAQWLPELPPSIPAGELDAWYAEEDRYLGDPSQERLHALIAKNLELVNTSRMPALSAISAIKYRALLIWQDRLRRRTENDPLSEARDVSLQGGFNAIWEVGEFTRQMINRDASALGMDPETKAKKLAGPALADQEHQLRVSWFWAGWLSDQGLFRTSREDKTKYGLWLSESLSSDGPYPIHSIYANARRQAVISNDPAAWWGEPVSRKRRIWDFSGLRSFAFQTRDLPTDPGYRNLYVTFTANCFRMNILLFKDDTIRTGVVWRKQNARIGVDEMVRFIETEAKGNVNQTETLKRELFSLIDGAKERI